MSGAKIEAGSKVAAAILVGPTLGRLTILHCCGMVVFVHNHELGEQIKLILAYKAQRGHHETMENLKLLRKKEW